MSLLYVCDGCSAQRNYLSTSWSTVTIITTVKDGEPSEEHEIKHFCLECRSDKKEWHGAAE